MAPLSVCSALTGSSRKVCLRWTRPSTMSTQRKNKRCPIKALVWWTARASPLTHRDGGQKAGVHYCRIKPNTYHWAEWQLYIHFNEPKSLLSWESIIRVFRPTPTRHEAVWKAPHRFKHKNRFKHTIPSLLKSILAVTLLCPYHSALSMYWCYYHFALSMYWCYYTEGFWDRFHGETAL